MKRVYLIILMLLAGCSSNVKSDWSCPVQQGKACVTIAQADKVDKSQKPENVTIKVKSSKVEESFVNSGLPLTSVKASRTQDKVSRVWFAPFIDNNNNLHEESYVYVIDENSRWQIGELE